MDDSYQQRLASASEIVKLFRWERFAHLFVSFCSAALVLFAGYKVLRHDNPSRAELTLLFGSGGLIAANAGMLFWMFNRVTQIVFADLPKPRRSRPRDDRL